MYLLEQLDAWSVRHHPKWLDSLRIVLGSLLIWKGIYFISHSHNVIEIIQSTEFEFYAMSAAHIAIGATILCGFMILFGLLTRAAVIIELPVLIAAVALTGYTQGYFPANNDFELAIIMILMLVFFFIEGSGTFSLDEYLKRHPDSSE